MTATREELLASGLTEPVTMPTTEADRQKARDDLMDALWEAREAERKAGLRARRRAREFESFLDGVLDGNDPRALSSALSFTADAVKSGTMAHDDIDRTEHVLRVVAKMLADVVTP